jgi:hypothetical protein
MSSRAIHRILESILSGDKAGTEYQSADPYTSVGDGSAATGVAVPLKSFIFAWRNIRNFLPSWDLEV